MLKQIETEEHLQNDYDKLMVDEEAFRISYLISKPCGCKRSNCKHYKEENQRLFNYRINNLLARGILRSAIVDANILRRLQKPTEGHKE